MWLYRACRVQTWAEKASTCRWLVALQGTREENGRGEREENRASERGGNRIGGE